MNFQSIMKNTVNNNFTVDFHIAVKNKLIILLKTVCNIDLSGMDDNDATHFQFEELHTHNPMIKYYFNYTGNDAGEAEALVILRPDGFFVSFQFYKKEKHHTLPAGSYCVDIDVDEDLNYQSATFLTCYNFGWKSTNRNHSGAFLFYKMLDEKLNITTVIKCRNDNSVQSISEFSSDELPSIFFSNNHHFYDVLKEMLEYCEMQPKQFYSVFTEYPDHIELSSSSEAIKQFLTLYNDQFTKDSSIIESRLLLLEMQEI